MRFSELPIGLQKTMQKAEYKNSAEIKNIVNRSLEISDNVIEFRVELKERIESLKGYLEMLKSDACENDFE
jgi:hypothetical protein